MRKLFILALLIGWLAGCGKDLKGNVILDNDASSVEHCVGSLKFKLPTSWQQEPSILSAFKPAGVDQDGDGIEVLTTMNISPADFKKIIAAHVGEIKSLQDANTDVLELLKDFGSDGVLIRIRRIGSSYSSEMHKLFGGTYVRLSTDSYNDTFVSAEQRLTDFLSGLRMAEVRAKDKFCLGNLDVTGDFAKESAKVLFKNSTHKDALISVAVDTYRPDEVESLFDRVSGPDSLLAIFGINPNVIRKREIVAAGMPAQEWMSWMPATDEKGSKHLHFAIETRRDGVGRDRPLVHIEFKTGRRGKDGSDLENTYEEADAVKLWDSLTSSLSLKKNF
jgi:hypothetical protein